MKTILPAILLSVLAALPTAAQVPVSGEGFQALKATHTELPVFPPELIQLGIREGAARIAFSVDAQGKVEDLLPVEYTDPEFARVSMNAIRRWKFEPAYYRGQPIAASSEVVLKFEVEGTVVVSLTAVETLAARIMSVGDRSAHYRPRGLKELDAIPIPITARSPGYPQRLAKSGGSGQVTVTFYIDESGTVRLPSIDSGSDPELGAAAIDAIRTWKFEPPTCKGRPVLVRASQQFNFGPLAAK